MSESLPWVPDVSRGEWLRSLVDADCVHEPIPRGFAARARILHPFERDRPRATGTWHGQIGSDTWDGGELDVESVTWATVAETFGTVLHPLAQSHRIARLDRRRPEPQYYDRDGWRYTDPEEGRLDPDILTSLAGHLADHTETPDAGIAAIWAGWGGLVSGGGSVVLYWAGQSGSRLLDPLLAVWYRIVTRMRNRVNRRRRSQPGTGLLSREAAEGPELHLPGRDYILFEMGARDCVDAGWPSRAPWVDPGWDVQTPTLLWPNDHAWLLITEIDLDSTIVAGSQTLIDSILADPRIEAVPVDEDADLTWEGDVLNPPAA